MRMTRSTALALLLACMAPATGHAAPASPATDDGVALVGLRAQLYYERSGTLSDDVIAHDPPLSFWNTVIGGGEADEPADNLLVSAVLTNPGEEAWLDENVTVRVSGNKGRKIAERTFKGLLLDAKGTLHLPLWLYDAGCLGPITITATFRKQAVSEELQLMCGE